MSPILGIIDSSKTAHLATASFTSIATITAAGGETSLTFSSIPQTFTDLQLRIFARDTYTGAGTDSVLMQFNSDTTTDYYCHHLVGNGASVTVNGYATSYVECYQSMIMAGAGSNIFGVGIVDIADYKNTSKYKTIKSIGGGDANSSAGAYNIALASSLWQNTNAITTITLSGATTAFAAGSVFALYGIKAAA